MFSKEIIQNNTTSNQLPVSIMCATNWTLTGMKKLKQELHMYFINLLFWFIFLLLCIIACMLKGLCTNESFFLTHIHEVLKGFRVVETVLAYKYCSFNLLLEISLQRTECFQEVGVGWIGQTEKNIFIYTFVMNLFFFSPFQQFSLIISELFEKVTDDYYLKEMQFVII